MPRIYIVGGATFLTRQSARGSRALAGDHACNIRFDLARDIGSIVLWIHEILRIARRRRVIEVVEEPAALARTHASRDIGFARRKLGGLVRTGRREKRVKLWRHDDDHRGIASELGEDRIERVERWKRAIDVARQDRR